MGSVHKGKAAAPTSLSWTHSRSRRFDLLYEWFVINGLSRSLINPVIKFNLRSMGSIYWESSDRFPEGRWRMFGSEAVLIIHLLPWPFSRSAWLAGRIAPFSLQLPLNYFFQPLLTPSPEASAIAFGSTRSFPLSWGHYNLGIKGDIFSWATQTI